MYTNTELKNIFEAHISTSYLQVTVLDWRENPLETIEGRITGGSLNMNGKTPVRSSGSLSIIADSSIYNITSIENLISLNKRISLTIGIKPFPSETLHWFPLGKFVIKNATLSENLQGITINAQISDYMSLLNGDISGVFPAGITHAPIYEYDAEGNRVSNNVLIYKLIQTLVYEFGGIPKDKIIIDNIANRIKNTVRWVGSKPVYLTEDKLLTTVQPEGSNYFTYNFQDNIGYTIKDFHWPVETKKEFTSAAGESVTQALDKIKNLLGNFEYFFDKDGTFYFQEIQNFLREGDEHFNLGEAISSSYLKNNLPSKSVYTIDRAAMISYNENPVYTNIKNDITVWGQDSETKSGIRYRVFIGEKPYPEVGETFQLVAFKDEFNNIRCRKPKTGETGNTIYASWTRDWRQLQYFRFITNQDSLEIPYGKELVEELPKIFKVTDLQTSNGGLGSLWNVVGNNSVTSWKYNIPNGEVGSPGNVTSLPYYIDIIDVTSPGIPIEVQSIAVEKIGWRPKVIPDNNINTLLPVAYENLVLIPSSQPETDSLRDECITKGIEYTQYSGALAKAIETGTAYNTAYDRLRSMIHTILSYNETINLSIIPNYTLEVNDRITVEKPDGTYSDYMINSINVPLEGNKAMNLNLSKAIEMI